MILSLHAALFVVLSSSSLACHVIWGRRYIWLASSSMLPCLLCCLLHHWLVSSSGVAGIADDLILPCCPVCCVVFFVPGLSCHLGSPVWLMILFLHAALFVVLSSSSLACLVIWGRRYSWWSYPSMLPCLLCCLLRPWLVIWGRRYSWWSCSSMLPCLLCCLLHPWLVPSSGVAGIADDLIPPCCPVCCVVFFIPGLSRHLGSPV